MQVSSSFPGRVVLLSGLAFTGCGHVRIHDAAVIEAAEAVGETSAQLVRSRGSDMPAQPRERAVEVESALVALALAHDEWNTAPSHPSSPGPIPTPTESLVWRDGHLQGGLELPNGGHLVSALRHSGERTEHGAPGGTADAVCPAGEVSGSGDGVWCPPFVDRAIRLERPVMVDSEPMMLRLRADYGMRLDGRGCAAGGQIDVTYALWSTTEQHARSGLVSADFHGCGRTQASTIEP